MNAPVTFSDYYFTGFSWDAYHQLPSDSRPQMVQDSTAVCMWKDKELQAMSMMDYWTKNSCRIHVTVFNPMALRHGFQQEVFSFIFCKAKRKVIVGVTPSDNKKALKFNKHMGFVERCRIKEGSEDGVDLVITEMRKADCRWIGQETL